jgi:hypothetical protein
MGYLQRLGLGQARYDRFPVVEVAGFDEQVWSGWEAVCKELQGALRGPGRRVLAVECYSGILDEEVVPALQEGLSPHLWIGTERAFRSAEAIDQLVALDLGGDDPIFGRFTRLKMEDFLEPERLAIIREQIHEVREGLVIVYGPGASLCCEPDLLVYADMPRWEAQLRQRAGRVSNLGVGNAGLKASLQYKRSYFIDWRVCDKVKRSTLARWDYVLETCLSGEPKLVTGSALRAGMKQTVARPFRVVPFFDPGVWGGQWMREVCGLSEEAPNYAWCFDCVPEENSLRLRFGQITVEIPSINLVFQHPVELLGEPVYGRYGAEFPIRFDFLDTMGGQNLSFQVHPLVDYAYEAFGLRYTQDESYYILDAEPDAVVYLGLKEEVVPEAMLADLETAAKDPNRPFDATRHVARFPARRHDHFLIPAGTCHCSGADSMVLEISHTPYIFTFKLWDWARLDLNGQPRPINLERGRANIQWDRREKWVQEHLVNAVEAVGAGPGWREERTGLYRSEAFETRRHWFTGVVPHDTAGDSVHVLNLVQGEEAVVESPVGAFAPFVVTYAETFIVPAAVGPYTIRPHGPSEGKECATMKAFIRVNA